MWEKEREENLKKLGEGIQKARKKKNVSQEELGNQLGIDKSTISRYEDGSIEIPASILPITADILKTDLTALWGTERGFTADDAINVLESLCELKNGRKKPILPDEHEMVPGSMMFAYISVGSSAKRELKDKVNDHPEIINTLAVGKELIDSISDDNAKAKTLAGILLDSIFKTDKSIENLLSKIV